MDDMNPSPSLLATLPTDPGAFYNYCFPWASTDDNDLQSHAEDGAAAHQKTMISKNDVNASSAGDFPYQLKVFRETEKPPPSRSSKRSANVLKKPVTKKAKVNSGRKPKGTRPKGETTRGREPMAVENIVQISPDATLFETTGLYHEELGSINIKDIKGVYKNCRGIWAAQWTDSIGQRHTKYFNPKYFSSEESARVNAYKFKLDVTLQMERAKAGADGIGGDMHRLHSGSGNGQAYRPITAYSSAAHHYDPTPQVSFDPNRSMGGHHGSFGSGQLLHPYESQMVHQIPETYSAMPGDSGNGVAWLPAEGTQFFTDAHMAQPLEPPKMENIGGHFNSLASLGAHYQPKDQHSLETTQISTYAVLIASVLGFCPCRQCSIQLLPADITPAMASQILKWTVDARMTNETASMTTIAESQRESTAIGYAPYETNGHGNEYQRPETAVEPPPSEAAIASEIVAATVKVEDSGSVVLSGQCLQQIGFTAGNAMGFNSLTPSQSHTSLPRVVTPNPYGQDKGLIGYSAATTADNTPELDAGHELFSSVT